MHFRIQKGLSGLREVLGFPGVLSLDFDTHAAHGVLNLEPFLLDQSRRIQSATANATIPNVRVGDITVPTGSLWSVEHVLSNSDVVDADQAVTFQTMLFINAANIVVGDVRVVPASEQGHSWYWFDRRLVLRAGDIIRTNILSITVGAAASVAMTTRVLYSELTP